MAANKVSRSKGTILEGKRAASYTVKKEKTRSARKLARLSRVISSMIKGGFGQR